jgi:Protein of unknown function (DUF1566)
VTNFAPVSLAMKARLFIRYLMLRWALLCTALTLVNLHFGLAHAVYNSSATQGIISNSAYLLEWDACADGQSGAACVSAATTFTWQQAIQRVVTINATNYKGFNDWRLPNKNELESLVDLSRDNPAIDPVFPNAPIVGFWSSTINVKNLGTAWKVNFSDGSVFADSHGTVAHIRVVRGGGASGSTDRFALPIAASTLEVVHFNATVFDTRTLLQWDRCPWGLSGASCGGGTASTMPWAQALNLAVLANAANHKGFSDWRLPNKNELESIVDLGVLPPSIEAAAFPNTPSATFFSSSVNTKNLEQAWKVSFNDGSVFADAHDTVANVRLVRGGGTISGTDRFNLPMPPSPYTLASGAVADTRTGLIWDNCSFGKTGLACTGGNFQVASWQDALVASRTANATNYKGFNDWRLPNKNELESLVDLGRLAPVIDPSVFPDTQSQLYWSSTVNVKSAGQAWYVNFNDGAVAVAAHGAVAYVRLVRGGDNADGLYASPECAGSTVATIAHVDLTAEMTAINALNYAKFRQTFNVTCANGRFGVVRIPGIAAGLMVGSSAAYALVQSSCVTKPVQQMANPAATATSVQTAMSRRANSALLATDALVGPLASWVCQ